jgi:hypothetical protein
VQFKDENKRLNFLFTQFSFSLASCYSHEQVECRTCNKYMKIAQAQKNPHEQEIQKKLQLREDFPSRSFSHSRENVSATNDHRSSSSPFI